QWHDRRVSQSSFVETRGQPSEDEALIVEFRHLRPVALLVIAHLGNCGIHSVRQVQHAETAITEARPCRIDVSKGRRCIGATDNAKGNLVTRYQLQAANLVL